ncbi:MAG: hypothetical protein AseanaTS_23870 [Candidatus Pelagadaptatus aseana]|uniref:hypothetical protein n=1 Tax=Candidatus Pelagadaptatus aseana TaxID=3120508 RepID=UPI0039B2F15D
MKLRLLTLLGVTAMGGVAMPLHAEVIKIPVGQQTTDQTISKPVLGMSMDSVLADYGEPLQRFDAVGEPPISRWLYEQFTVYFEHDTVMHSVIKHTPKTELQGDITDSTGQ